MGLIRFQRIAVAQLSCCGCAGVADKAGQTGQTQFAFSGVDDGRRRSLGQGHELRYGEGLTTDADFLQSVGNVQIDRAGDAARLSCRPIRRQARFVYIGLTGRSAVVVYRDDGRCAVGHALDGDGQLREIGRTVRVGQPVGELLGERVAALQCIDRRVGGVQRVDVGTVGADLERAVGSDDLGAGRTGRAGRNRIQAAACAFRTGADAGDRQFGRGVVYVAVLTGGARRHVAAYRSRVLVNRIDVIDCFGRIIYRIDGDDLIGRSRAAITVTDDVGEAHRAVIVRIGREADVAAGVDVDLTVRHRNGLGRPRRQRDPVDADDAQRAAIDIAVSG